MAGARPDTWMPLYWGDYLRDTLNLRAEGHGAYMLLIAAYWTSGEPLPDDDDQLMAITRLDDEAWKRLRPILARFFQVADGVWRHRRIDAELAKAIRITEARQESGKRGGERKANNLANAKQKPTPSQPQPHSLTGDSEPIGSAEPTCPDLRKSIFDDDVPWLAKASSRHMGSIRPVVARWCQEFGDAAVIAVLQECRRSPPAEPVSWITARLKGSCNAQRPEPEGYAIAFARAAGAA